MGWILTFLTFTSCLFLIVGDHVSDLFRTTYVNRNDEICKVFSDLEKNPITFGGLDICNIFVPNQSSFPITSKIKRGTFNDDEGFVLILTDSSTIDIPAIIECSFKGINYEVVHYSGKAIVFYLVPYKVEDETNFMRAMSADKTDTRNKTMFVLQGADLIQTYEQTYNDRTARKFVERWFEKKSDNEENGKKKCERLSELGLLNEELGVPWILINGEIISSVEKKNQKKHRKRKTIKKRTEDFYLRLTDSTEIKLIGVIKCEVKSKTSSSQNIIEKYFTVTYKNKEMDILPLSGPIRINEKQIFLLHTNLRNYDLLHKQSQSITPTEE